MSAMQSGCGCSCGSGDAGPKVIFSCSGCADVGELADQTARKLTRDGAGKMACLAGISGRVSGIVKSTEAAQSILAIDGCPLDCTRKTLEITGFSKVNHLRFERCMAARQRQVVAVRPVVVGRRPICRRRWDTPQKSWPLFRMEPI